MYRVLISRSPSRPRDLTSLPGPVVGMSPSGRGGRRRDVTPRPEATNERPLQRARHFSADDAADMAKAMAHAMQRGGDSEMTEIAAALKEYVSEMVMTAVRSAADSLKASIATDVAEAVKEEFEAENVRRPPAADVHRTADLVIAAIKLHLTSGTSSAPSGAPFEQRPLDDVRVAVGRAISMPHIRRAHVLAVRSRVLGLAGDPEAKGDCLTPFCPTASKTAGTTSFVVKNFNRVVMALYNKLLVDMAASNNQPAVFHGKGRVNPSRLDRIDLVAVSIVRQALNDVRSLAREMMYTHIGYPFMSRNPTVSLRMAFPDEFAVPRAAEAANSKYFRATTDLFASVSGVLAQAGEQELSTAEEGDEQPSTYPQHAPAGQRKVSRSFCLFQLADEMLVALVRHAHDFEADVIMAVAECFRSIVVAGRVAWCSAVDIETASEAAKGPCCWGLLIPRAGKRAQIDIVIQKLAGGELDSSSQYMGSGPEVPVDAVLDVEGDDDVDDL